MKSQIEKYKTLIFVVTRSIGRNIFATAVVRNIKAEYPDKQIIVVAGFPDVFLYNPKVRRVYGFNAPFHLYEDHIDRNPDAFIIDVEPYRHPAYLTGTRHIVECWCDLIEIPCVEKYPEIFFARNEEAMAEAHIRSLEFQHNRPVILFQHQGGQIPSNDTEQERISKLGAMYRRALPNKCIQEITDTLYEDGYLVGSVGTETQFVPKNSERITHPIRAIMALLPHVSGIIAIDSFLAHAAAAVGRQSLVLWCGTSPDKLGYEKNVNLRRSVCPTPECHRPNSYAWDIQPNGFIWDCPHRDICVEYDSKEVIEEFKKMQGEKYVSDVENFKKPQLIDIPVVKHSCEKKGM